MSVIKLDTEIIKLIMKYNRFIEGRISKDLFDLSKFSINQMERILKDEYKREDFISDDDIMKNISLLSSREHFKFVVNNSDVNDDIKEKMISYFPYIDTIEFYMMNNYIGWVVNCFEDEIDILRDRLFSFNVSSDEREMLKEKIAELRKKGDLSLSVIVFDLNKFLDALGKEQYISLTNRYNNLYKAIRYEELENNKNSILEKKI